MLSDEEIEAAIGFRLYEYQCDTIRHLIDQAVEAKLIEKLQAQSEPVATKNSDGITLHFGWDDLPVGTKLFAAPVRQEQVERPCHVFNVKKSGSLTEWEPTTMAFALPDGIHALYTHPAPVQHDVNQQLLEALKAIADYPELDALELKREARAAIAAAERKK